jgi:hypothetical protein
MIANFQSEYFEGLKKLRAEVYSGTSFVDNFEHLDYYDYDKFLSDSSDDYPKYADGIDITGQNLSLFREEGYG